MLPLQRADVVPKKTYTQQSTNLPFNQPTNKLFYQPTIQLTHLSTNRPFYQALPTNAPKHHYTLHYYDGKGNAVGFVTSLDVKQSSECPVFIGDPDIQTAGYTRTESILHHATQSNASMPMTDKEIAMQLQVANNDESGNITSSVALLRNA